MEKHKIKISLLMLYILIALQYLYLVSDLFPSYIQIVIFLLLILFSGKKSRILAKGFKLSLVNLIILLITFFRCVIADQLNMSYYSSLQVLIQRYQFFVYPIVFFYVIQLNEKEKKSIFNWAIFCITITVIFSLYYVLFVNPQAIRDTHYGHLWGVGDFQLMYAIAILFGPLLFLIIDRIKNKNKCFYLVISLILMGLCLILCNLVTSVVVAIISIFITYCITKRSKSLYLIISIFLPVAWFCKKTIARSLIYIANKNLFYWSTNNKILAIANVLLGEFSNVDTLSRRWMLINQSLTSFKQHPIFGINFKEHVSGKIGCHCQWPDDLARFGIVGNFIIWFNYIHIAKVTIRNSNDQMIKNVMISSWICFFILGFLNPCLSGTILMVIFVISPCFHKYNKLSRSKYEKNIINKSI